MGAVKAFLIAEAEARYGPTSPECDHALGVHEERIARCCDPNGCECCDLDDPCGPPQCRLCKYDDESGDPVFELAYQLDDLHDPSGRACALAGRDPFGPDACQLCSAAVLAGR